MREATYRNGDPHRFPAHVFRELDDDIFQRDALRNPCVHGNVSCAHRLILQRFIPVLAGRPFVRQQYLTLILADIIINKLNNGTIRYMTGRLLARFACMEIRSGCIGEAIISND